MVRRYIERIRIKFSYEGHRIKVKVARVKSAKVPYPDMKTPILWKIKP